MENEYDGDVSCLIDIVCASTVVADKDQLITVAKAFDDEKVVWLKNRFKEPLFTGYRNVLYNIEFKN
eukprot:10409639-Ditylum_brightwellii.AAC.1